MAQTTKVVTFTAASPPILTATDIRNALISAFPTSASFEKFIAVIHPDVTTIGGSGNGFSNTYNLIPAGSFNVREYLIAVEGENVTTINDGYCFGSVTNPLDACYNLASVDFPKVQTIGNGAFLRCTSLESIEFPLAETIGQSAFSNCTGLLNLTLGAAPPTLGTNVFNGVTLLNVTLHIPEGSLCDYQDDSDWGTAFLDQFAAVEEYSVSTPVTYYTLSMNVNGNGSATSGATGITCGNTKTLTATPDACNQFVNWTSGGGFSSTANPLDIVVKSDTNIVANFIPITGYTLSAVSNNTTMGTASSSVSSATCGSSVSVTATPNAGHVFRGWEESVGVVVSTANPYTFNIGANRVLTAIFDVANKKQRIKKINVKKGRLIITPQP
ncbi:MAG: leucine-rich repeat protein [Bacteroidetes bacterium]|nr:leucine-rich repeat protein [Bacteroidota bacterium]